MATKPGAKECRIKEQIVDDQGVTGITLQFKSHESGECTLDIFGNFPFGNRSLMFDKNGELAGAGTHLGECPPATWIKEINCGSRNNNSDRAE